MHSHDIDVEHDPNAQTHHICRVLHLKSCVYDKQLEHAELPEVHDDVFFLFSPVSLLIRK
jgi:hypothetical protein